MLAPDLLSCNSRCLQSGDLVTFVRGELASVHFVEVVDAHWTEESWGKMPLHRNEIAGVTSASISHDPCITSLRFEAD